MTAAAFAITAGGIVTVAQSPMYVPTYVIGGESGIFRVGAAYTSMELQVASNTIMQIMSTGVFMPSHMLRIGGQLRAGVNAVDVTTPTGMLDMTKLTVPFERRGDLVHRASGGWSGLRPGNSGLFLQSAGENADLVWSDVTLQSANWTVSDIVAVFDGAGSVLNSGIRFDLPLDFAATINQVTLTGYPTGSLVVDVYKTSYASFPGSTGQSITASAKPTLTGAIKYQDSTLTGWTTAITAGDVLRYNIDSVSSTILATLSIKATRT